MKKNPPMIVEKERFSLTDRRFYAVQGRLPEGSLVTARLAGQKIPVRIEQRSAFRGQPAGFLPRAEDFGENGFQSPGISVVRDQAVKCGNHSGVVVASGGIDRHHAGSVSNTEDFLPGEQEMNPSGKCSQEIDLPDMCFAVQDCLVQMAQAPALRHIEGKEGSQLFGRFTGDRIPPGAERNEQVHSCVEGKIPMHHRTDADSTDFGERYMIAAAHVGCHLRETGLDTSPGTVKIIRPDAVLQLVFPLIAGRRQCLATSVHEHSFDSCRPQLNTKGRFAIFNAGRILHKFHQ